MTSQDHHALLEEYNDDMRERQNLIVENEQMREALERCEAALERIYDLRFVLPAGTPLDVAIEIAQEALLPRNSVNCAGAANEVAPESGEIT